MPWYSKSFSPVVASVMTCSWFRGAVSPGSHRRPSVGEDGRARKAGPDHLACAVRLGPGRARRLGGGDRLLLGLPAGDARREGRHLDRGLVRLRLLLRLPDLAVWTTKVATQHGKAHAQVRAS